MTKRNDNDVDIDDAKSGIDMNLLQLLKSSAMTGPLDKFKSHRLTLATLLEVLDGVMEMDGRMLVITTNYPDRLDKALIRPGRIDMKVKFCPSSAEDIIQMYQALLRDYNSRLVRRLQTSGRTLHSCRGHPGVPQQHAGPRERTGAAGHTDRDQHQTGQGQTGGAHLGLQLTVQSAEYTCLPIYITPALLDPVEWRLHPLSWD